MYKSQAVDLHVITGGFITIAYKYVRFPLYGQQTEELYQQLWYIHAWIEPKVTVNVAAMT